MSERIKILILPCGTENASEIHQALRHSLHVELFGASSVEDHGRFRFERYAGGLPNIRDQEFDAALAVLISQWHIDIVFATDDSVHEYLATRAAAMTFFLVNGDPHTAAISCRHSAIHGSFASFAWAPKVFGAIEDVQAWPIVVKPDLVRRGQSVTVHGPAEAARVVCTLPEPVLVEYLPGTELTVDCFSNRQRKLVWAGPRTRERVKAGIAMRCMVQTLPPEIEAIAETINKRLQLRGPWFFQLKGDSKGNWKLQELCCRAAGGMVAQRARGINLPLMTVHDYLGREVTALPNPQVKLIERSITTRAELEFEYDTVFVDLDDTLLIGDTANPPVFAFLYQSVRDGKRLKLITRHARDVAHTLERARIAAKLFDEIIHLKAGQSKADYVTDRSIFVDNHFPERLDVARRKGIPVFDVDALEFFIR